LNVASASDVNVVGASLNNVVVDNSDRGRRRRRIHENINIGRSARGPKSRLSVDSRNPNWLAVSGRSAERTAESVESLLVSESLRYVLSKWSESRLSVVSGRPESWLSVVGGRYRSVNCPESREIILARNEEGLAIY